MADHPQDSKEKEEKIPDHEGFMQRLSDRNILSDAMLVEVDQTDFTNILIAEESIQDDEEQKKDQT
ncbi:hypothetical protein [Geosporobacter ferrireducens]|uniref:Uncharacterized protein n=1 Tax=Geosporobacter ferrireducens TaxID=1424294 RepID=A0A1D8GGG1_9FIRM|nr:hypothetical protein [Geosporobacter ferrireducens]AOT69989.1 hypothetical protein Gferi_10565 [Geosporobacter ferrireducens]MTI53468.1 hypothetical protein [Geosporobacter ferrireducens]